MADQNSCPGFASVPVVRARGGAFASDQDELAVEAPLEIRLGCEIGGRRTQGTVAVTMRTPGHDAELAVGYLFTEGILAHRAQIENVHAGERPNAARVDLRSGTAVDWERLERRSYVSSSCGVCGKASWEAARIEGLARAPAGRPVIEVTVVQRLPEALRAAQALFQRTGGLHAAALFDVDGRLLEAREDVGRHNALDKLIGARFLAGATPLSETVVFLSGRVSFELVQKAAVAAAPIVAAVGAPSTMAVELARELGMTVLGFVRPDHFNIYSGPERIRGAPGGLSVAGPTAISEARVARRSRSQDGSGSPETPSSRRTARRREGRDS